MTHDYDLVVHFFLIQQSDQARSDLERQLEQAHLEQFERKRAARQAKEKQRLEQEQRGLEESKRYALRLQSMA